MSVYSKGFLFCFTVNTRPLQEVQKKSGADIKLDPNPSPVPGMKIVIIYEFHLKLMNESGSSMK